MIIVLQLVFVASHAPEREEDHTTPIDEGEDNRDGEAVAANRYWSVFLHINIKKAEPVMLCLNEKEKQWANQLSVTSLITHITIRLSTVCLEKTGTWCYRYFHSQVLSFGYRTISPIGIQPIRLWIV